MSRKLRRLLPMLRVVAVGFLLIPFANAQAPTLEEQLAAQYKLVKMGSDTSGYSVVDKGTVLAIQKGGVLGVPYSDQSVLSTKYENGTVHSPNTMLSKGIGFGMKRFGKEQTTHLFQTGDKVYPSKIDVNLSKDMVTLGIVACDTCNKTDPPTYNKANIVFIFPKGTLASASAGQVEDTIGQLLAVSTDDQGGAAARCRSGWAAASRCAAATGSARATPAEPASIDKGMTPDQVQAALGKPDKIVNLGAKQIYVYKDLKVTFLSGKVSDVQ